LTAIYSGLDVFLRDPSKYIQGSNLGLVANHTSISKNYVHSIVRLKETKSIKLAKLFAPEHGLFGVDQDMALVPDITDPFSGLPVQSLYGKDTSSLAPAIKSLKGIDTLIFDIQDIGSRYYTFIYTMANCMHVCKMAGIRFVVCDRPNPINGVQVEGNLVEEDQKSFVGQYPLPNRHGMTVGELAKLFKEEFDLDCDLKVVPIEGWKREMWYDQTGLPWVAPSPNMPSLGAAIVYPGMCLLEGTHLSEGRGTTQPFELFGAPYTDSAALADELNQEKLPGVYFRPHYFKPTFQKWAKQVCGGVFLHVVDRNKFKPLITGIAVIKTIAKLFPDKFEWRKEPYEFVSDRPAIDLLYGSSNFRKGLISSTISLSEVQATWESDEKAFLKMRKNYLMY
jgi:uncharacterized protein YbbC (DUF1343 family)